MKETKLFYSPLWEADLTELGADWDQHRARMLDKVFELEKSEHGVEKTNFGGWQSHDELYVHDEFGWLIDQIMRLSNEVAPEYDSALVFNNGHLWANVNRAGNFNAMHTHPNSLLSGVVYLQTSGSEQGVIEFMDCREGSPTTHWQGFSGFAQSTPFTEGVHSVAPKEGTILFFPGWLKHWVSPNLSDTERVSLSFNIRSD